MLDGVELDRYEAFRRSSLKKPMQRVRSSLRETQFTVQWGNSSVPVLSALLIQPPLRRGVCIR